MTCQPPALVFEDDDLLVLDKPSGMLVHPTGLVRDGTLLDAATAHVGGGYSGLVHRLDRETSGLVIVAKTPRAHAVLSRHFQERRVEKRYAALVHGPIVGDHVIQAPIGRSVDQTPHWRVLPDGRPAETRLRTITSGPRSRVELTPVTGRTNQLRVHCAHVGHPIVGDHAYGSDADTRLCLHAGHLAFHHPRGGAWMVFDAPADFEAP